MVLEVNFEEFEKLQKGSEKLTLKSLIFLLQENLTHKNNFLLIEKLILKTGE